MIEKIKFKIINNWISKKKKKKNGIDLVVNKSKVNSKKNNYEVIRNKNSNYYPISIWKWNINIKKSLLPKSIKLPK